MDQDHRNVSGTDGVSAGTGVLPIGVWCRRLSSLEKLSIRIRASDLERLAIEVEKGGLPRLKYLDARVHGQGLPYSRLIPLVGREDSRFLRIRIVELDVMELQPGAETGCLQEAWRRGDVFHQQAAVLLGGVAASWGGQEVTCPVHSLIDLLSDRRVVIARASVLRALIQLIRTRASSFFDGVIDRAGVIADDIYDGVPGPPLGHPARHRLPPQDSAGPLEGSLVSISPPSLSLYSSSLAA
jgi:hypothetical protein